MENNEKENKPIPPATDLNSQMFQEMLRMRQELEAVKNESKKNSQQTPEIQNVNLRDYNKQSNFYEERNTGITDKTTFGEIWEPHKKNFLEGRERFISEQLYPNPSSDYEDNKIHYQETAFINIYEQSDSKFREIVGWKMEKLKRGEYTELLDQHMKEEKLLSDIHILVENKPLTRSSDQAKLTAFGTKLSRKLKNL